MNSKNKLYKIIQAVFASLLGIQRADKMREDANNFKAYHFIIAGIVALILLITLLIIIVSYAT